jgi:heme o synthase
MAKATEKMSGSLKSYYQLTKPGIIRGNLFTALAGFLLASKGSVSYSTLFALITGMTLVIASSCVFNNYIDRNIDKKMSRTKHRALVEGTISPANALIFGTVLFILGAALLIMGTNRLTLIIGLLGAFFYVVIYGIGKRTTVHGTLIGSISGAIPPVAGYTAVTGRVDSAAMVIFLILVFWQMPHFFAIATYRRKEYAAAGLPVFPVMKDVSATRKQMLVYIILFALACSLLTVLKYTGYFYLVIMVISSLWWFYIGLKKYKLLTPDLWARSMFRISLLVIAVWSLSLCASSFLP